MKSTSFRNASSEIRQPSDTAGNQPQRLSDPNRELASRRRLADSRYFPSHEVLTRPKNDMRLHCVAEEPPELSNVPMFRVRISSSGKPDFDRFASVYVSSW